MPFVKTARFILKIVALSLSIAAIICAIIAYWDKLMETAVAISEKFHAKTACFASEYDDYEE